MAQRRQGFHLLQVKGEVDHLIQEFAPRHLARRDYAAIARFGGELRQAASSPPRGPTSDAAKLVIFELGADGALGRYPRMSVCNNSKHGHRALDMIGGTSELGEDIWIALRREMREELNAETYLALKPWIGRRSCGFTAPATRSDSKSVAQPAREM